MVIMGTTTYEFLALLLTYIIVSASIIQTSIGYLITKDESLRLPLYLRNWAVEHEQSGKATKIDSAGRLEV
jgi:hypothetical protein